MPRTPAPKRAHDLSAAPAGRLLHRIAPHDRPREKLERSGPASLGDTELLAVLIGHGTSGLTAVGLAEALMLAAGSARGLTRLTRDEIASLPGFGSALAARVIAGVELGRRTLTHRPSPRMQILSPRDVAAILLPEHGAYPVERAGVVLLDARHRLLGVRAISVGTLDASVVHPRDIFRPAIALGAAAVVVFHNHPSGDPTPSDDDIELTRRLVTAGELVGIDVVDHLVLADARYCSIRRADHR